MLGLYDCLNSSNFLRGRTSWPLRVMGSDLGTCKSWSSLNVSATLLSVSLRELIMLSGIFSGGSVGGASSYGDTNYHFFPVIVGDRFCLGSVRVIAINLLDAMVGSGDF